MLNAFMLFTLLSTNVDTLSREYPEEDVRRTKSSPELTVNVELGAKCLPPVDGSTIKSNDGTELKDTNIVQSELTQCPSESTEGNVSHTNTSGIPGATEGDTSISSLTGHTAAVQSGTLISSSAVHSGAVQGSTSISSSAGQPGAIQGGTSVSSSADQLEAVRGAASISSSTADQRVILRKGEQSSGAQTVPPVSSIISATEGAAPVSGLKRVVEAGRPRSGILSSVSEESDVINSHDTDPILPDVKSTAWRHSVAGNFGQPGDAGSAGIATSGILKESPAFQGGVSPAFLFLQLFYTQCIGKEEDRPVPIPLTESNCQSLKILDMTFPYETHKIGVIYVKPGQTRNEKAILSNMYGSIRYMSFIQSLGQLLRLTDCDPMSTYVGGLDSHGADGLFAYAWHAEFMQVIFHVVTLMPFTEEDTNFTEKKKHIGNDYVTIVYDDSGEEYRMGTIKGQFNFVNIIIKPLDQFTNEITVQTKPEIEDMIGHTDTKIISDTNLSLLVRQMAVHANLAATIYVHQKIHPLNPYASNWLERLRRIKQIRDRVVNDRKKPDAQKIGALSLDDFADFIQ